MKKQNIAARIKAYYDSEDFKGMYVDALRESFGNSQNEILKRIQKLFNDQNYETSKYFDLPEHVTYEQALKVWNYIRENFDAFVQPYCNHYVGHTCLASVQLGEQCESLMDIVNHGSKKPKCYGIKYLRKIFQQEDFYVDSWNAYYNLDGGLYVELRNCKDEIDAILNA